MLEAKFEPKQKIESKKQSTLIVKEFYNPFRYIWKKLQVLEEQKETFFKNLEPEYVLKSISSDFNKYVDEIAMTF